MIDFKRKRRAFFIPILSTIRFILNKFKEYAYPTFRSPPDNAYDLYNKEQLINCYNHFKNKFKERRIFYFMNSFILLQRFGNPVAIIKQN